MKRTALLTFALLFILAGIGYAQHHQGMGKGSCGQGPGMGMEHGFMGGGGHGQQGMGMCMRGIDLTEDQEKKLQKIKHDHKRKMLEMGTNADRVHGKMKLLITADKFDKSELNKIIDKTTAHKKEMMTAHVMHMRNLRDILTDDQKIKFDNNIMSPGHGGGKHFKKAKAHFKKGKKHGCGGKH